MRLGVRGCSTNYQHLETYMELAMPLTGKGKKIKSSMQEEYGSKKGEEIFYASINKGKIKGAEKKGKHSGK
jgi:hypothetical protein